MTDLPRIFGGYVLLKMLGAGASGDVFLARPRDPAGPLPAAVVIKRLHRELNEQHELTLRFRHEAEIAVNVDSPHLARVYDVGRVGQTYYLAMEYIAGWTVSRILGDLRQAEEGASLASVRDIVSDLLEGLHTLHSATDPKTGASLSIVHRDVAPKNLMLGEDSITRLIDLGLGRSRFQDWKTGTGVLLGSPGYMSPEQTAGERADHRTDLYAAGIVLWELLTTEYYIKRGPVPAMLRSQASPVFSAPSLYRDDVSPALDAVVQRALARDPRERFHSAREFQEALVEAVGRPGAERSSATIVGRLLWSELDAEKTTFGSLLASERAMPTEMTEEDINAETFASRLHDAGSPDALAAGRLLAPQRSPRLAAAPVMAHGDTALPGATLAPVPLGTGAPLAAQPFAPHLSGVDPRAFGPPTPLSFTNPFAGAPTRRPSAGLPLSLVLILCAGMSAAGLGIGIGWGRLHGGGAPEAVGAMHPPAGPEEEPAPLVAPAGPHVQAGTARPVAQPAATGATTDTNTDGPGLEAPASAERSTAAPRQGAAAAEGRADSEREGRGRAPTSERPQETRRGKRKGEGAAPAETERVLGRDDLLALVKRAQSLRSQRTPGSEAALGKLVAELSLEAGRDEIDPARARALEAEVVRWERQ